MVVDLTSIGNGAAAELFRRDLESVIKNIADPKASFKQKRKITLTFEISTDETREVLEVKIASQAKLAPSIGKKALCYLSLDEDGEPRATINDPKQAELAFGLAQANQRINGGENQ